MLRGRLTGLAVVAAVMGCTQTREPAANRTAQDAASPRKVRVAGIVLKWIPADKEANYRRAESLIREAAARDADIVVTTECFLDGYAIRDKRIPIDAWRALGEEIPGGPYVNRLRKLADELDVHLVAGMVERDGENTHNTAVIIGPDGTLLGKYRKQCLGHELPRNTPGSASPVFDTPHGKVGLVICADRRDPGVVRAIRDNGAELIVCPSGGMWGPVKNDYHLQDRSRENQVPIVFVHPIEFLVTGADGSILDRRFAGTDMDIPPDQAGGPRDDCLIAIHDLTVPGRAEGSKPAR